MDDIFVIARRYSMVLGKIAFWLLIIGIGTSSLLHIFQKSFIFHPQDISRDRLNEIQNRYNNVEEIQITVEQDINIRGWFVNNSEDNLLIYFGGNAEEVSHMIEPAQKYDNWSFVIFNYRGYGKSEGNPGEAKLYNDAQKIYDHFVDRQAQKYSKVVAMGRSLGTGVATYLAKNRKTDGVVLVSPFDNLISMGRRFFPFLPIDLLLKHRFNSIKRARKIQVPVQIIIATDDFTVPPKYSRRLARGWAGPTSVDTILGADHNSIDDTDKYWDLIDNFLKKVEQGSI